MAKTRIRKKRPVKQTLSVAEAAKLVHMTPGGIYAAIKRGDLVATRGPARITVKRAHVLKFRRDMDEALRRMDKNRPLTDEEFLQRLWDSDPD
jgi:hypothetical protein